jgi:hypothetical protein
MSVWYFTTANGEVFEVQGPAGVTYDQAAAVFNKQVTTGGLTGIPVGGLLNAVTQSLDGLSTAPANIGPDAVKVAEQQGGNISLPTQPGDTIPTAITASDFINTKTVYQIIGTVASPQVQGLVATTAAVVDQAPNVITTAKGLGKYGFNADQLQLAGFIKPGIAKQVLQDPANTVSILSSPTSWTGKQGVTDINTVLNNVNLQTGIQQELMQTTFNQLKLNGTITGTEPSSALGPLVNAATKYGVDSVTTTIKNATSGLTLSPDATGIYNFLSSSIFGSTFGSTNQSLSGGGNPLSAGIVAAKGYINTINRVNVNQAMKAIIGNPKIPTPYFQSSGASISNPAAALATIQSTISTLVSSGLSIEQIVDIVNNRSGSTVLSTNGGILRTADGAPITDRSGNSIGTSGDSATLGSGITSADKAAMFSGAASAATGTSNDGVSSGSKSASTSTGFGSSFSSDKIAKAAVAGVISGNLPGALAKLGISAVSTSATNSAISSISAAAPTAVTAAVTKALDGLTDAATANPKGFQAAVAAVGVVASSFGPLGIAVAAVVSATVSPAINAALANQLAADLAVAQAFGQPPPSTGITGAISSAASTLGAAVTGFGSVVSTGLASLAKALGLGSENDGGFGVTGRGPVTGIGTDVDAERNADRAGFSGQAPGGPDSPGP